MSASTTARMAIAVSAMTSAIPFSRGDPARALAGAPKAAGARRSRARESSEAASGSSKRTTGAAVDGAMPGGERTGGRSLVPPRRERRLPEPGPQHDGVLVEVEREVEAEREPEDEEASARAEERPRLGRRLARVARPRTDRPEQAGQREG